ncbi:DUF4328 domain-containing protein [Nocardia sp. NPDC005978]|uniref:DUF4328 domain-containing protein n=1 Tax=Nocardia sp. NPDC005978 TaxID=3156725 RepID=UPI0033BA66AB
MTGGNVGQPRSAVVQPCARCGARWAVQGKPLHWCPRCHGVLLSPAPVDAPPERRNYRWVARPPGRKAPHPGTPRRTAPNLATPHYTQIPRWGLQDRQPQTAAEPVHRIDRLVARLPRLLVTTAVVFGVAALTELGRYGILLRNRRRLIEPWLLWLSDAAVTVAAVTAMVVALITAVAVVGWLARTRTSLYAAAGREDSRSLAELFAGCLVPGVNLVWPGVFLTETVRVGATGADEPRLLRMVRIWWAAWVLNGLLVVIAVLYRFGDSLQVRADGVLITLWTDAFAAGIAVLTLWLVRGFAGRDLRGRELTAQRWLIATTPAAPVIEPVQPGSAAAAGRAPATAVGNDEAIAAEAAGPESTGAPEAEHEEVLAK